MNSAKLIQMDIISGDNAVLFISMLLAILSILFVVWWLVTRIKENKEE